MSFLFLFDIDMTLIDTGGSGRRALEGAFSDLFGIENAFDGYHFQGKVDRAIFAEVYGRNTGLVLEDDVARELGRGYLVRLEEELAAGPYRILPGVLDLLRLLEAREDCFLGLATGNLEAAAHMKLAWGGLDGYFLAGGYGSDSAFRATLTRLGIERLSAAARSLGGTPPVGDARRRRVLVVGDTPADIAAAAANGVTSVAIATGGVAREDLADCGPDLLFDDMREFMAEANRNPRILPDSA